MIWDILAQGGTASGYTVPDIYCRSETLIHSSGPHVTDSNYQSFWPTVYIRDESQEVAAAYGAVCTPDPFLFTSEDGAFQLVYHGRIDDARNPR